MAETDMTVLVLGETGTGKDLLAEIIHNPESAARVPPLSRSIAGFCPLA